MTTMMNSVKCQEQQKERACKQRVLRVLLWISGNTLDVTASFVIVD